MLNLLVAHAGSPLAPHDLAGAWNLDPVLLVVLFALTWAYRRGRAPGPRSRDAWRARAFAAAMLALVIALVSPLEALSGTLASAHMVQHVLLLLVAAPLLAVSAPTSGVLRGSPLAVRRAATATRRRLRPATTTLVVLGGPVVVWSAHVLTVWTWHSSVLYEAALGSEWLHVVEHAAFVVTGVAFWRLVAGARGGHTRVPRGLGVLLVFGMAMSGVFLSALLTFAPEPWYPSYTATEAWGLTALADQHLAGVIMWIPGSITYLAVALSLLASWLRDLDADAHPDVVQAGVGDGPPQPATTSSSRS